MLCVVAKVMNRGYDCANLRRGHILQKICEGHEYASCVGAALDRCSLMSLPVAPHRRSGGASGDLAEYRAGNEAGAARVIEIE